MVWLTCYLTVRLLKAEKLEGDPWQVQGIDLKQGAFHCPLGMYDLESTEQALFINESDNETAAAQGPWQGDRVDSGKECS